MKRSMMATGASVIICVLALSGCATPGGSADVYGASQAQREATIRMGTVESVRGVTIDSSNGQPGVLGAIAAACSAASREVPWAAGAGRSSRASSAGIAGAVAGDEVQHKLELHHGEEITVRLDDGSLRAITQSSNGEMFRAGDGFACYRATASPV